MAAAKNDVAAAETKLAAAQTKLAAAGMADEKQQAQRYLNIAMQDCVTASQNYKTTSDHFQSLSKHLDKLLDLSMYLSLPSLRTVY